MKCGNEGSEPKSKRSAEAGAVDSEKAGPEWRCAFGAGGFRGGVSRPCRIGGSAPGPEVVPAAGITNGTGTYPELNFLWRSDDCELPESCNAKFQEAEGI